MKNNSVSRNTFIDLKIKVKTIRHGVLAIKTVSFDASKIYGFRLF